MREQTRKENELDVIASLLSDRSEAGVYAKGDGLLAEQTRLEQRLSEVEVERGDLRDALVRVFEMGDGVTHDAQILAAAVDLMAEQTRLREALQTVKDYWTRYGFSGWKGDDDFDRLSQQIDAALSSTPTPEHSK